MDDKEKAELEQILSKSRRIQFSEIKERDKQRQKDIAKIEEEILEINDENKKEKEKVTKNKTNKSLLKCNLL